MKNNNEHFTSNLYDVEQKLLSLNGTEGIKIKKIKPKTFEIAYNGGYNGVYDYKVTVRILENTQNIHNMWYYWSFEVVSEDLTNFYEVDNVGWNTGFLDFFIDDFIKYVGVILTSEEDV